MAITKLIGSSLTNDTINATQLDETANYDFTGTVTGAGGTNAPFFKAYMSANQAVSNTTSTTVAFDQTSFDTASSFNTATYKYIIPTGYGGKWLFTFMIRKENFLPTRSLAVLFADSTELQDIENGGYTDYGGASGSAIVNVSAGQAIYVNYYHNGGTSRSIRGNGARETTFSGFKLID